MFELYGDAAQVFKKNILCASAEITLFFRHSSMNAMLF